MLHHALLLCLAFTLVADAVPLNISQANGAPGLLRKITPGSWELRTSNGISLHADPATPPPANSTVLEFDYFCLGNIPRFAVIPGPPFNAETARWSDPLGHSEAWTPHRVRLALPDNPLTANWKRLRLDLPITTETTLRIRNLQLRPERPGEFGPATPSHANTSASLRAYLDATYPARIDHVEVTETEIRIRGHVGKLSGLLAIAEIPMHRLLSDPGEPLPRTDFTPAEDGSFTITVPRVISGKDRQRNRLTSKWQVVRTTRSAPGPIPVSAARYADTIACRTPGLPPAVPTTKKGLGGWSNRRGVQGELEALGIAAVTINVKVEKILSLAPGPDTSPHPWEGRTYHVNRPALERYDSSLREAAKRDVMVSAILLVGNPARTAHPVTRLMGHPDAAPEGTFAMPNVTDADGLGLYGAALDVMAERWSRPDGKFGRVHHWIVHNEVDAGWVWTNCGRKELLPYVDLYHRSARLVHLITRQYDPNAMAFVSLTHHWAKTVRPEFYPSRDILETFAEISRHEGDFPWALAHHPYPQSLRHPRTWEDQQATGTFDTAKITPHNIEVLDRWMKTPAMRFQGTAVRPVHLSENGFNSPDYSKKSLTDQAAGMAYAWRKISKLDSIQMWHYHNWIDNRHEGGLRIGLRKFPDEPGDPYGKKPIWHLYQSLATPHEDEACAPYLRYINAR